MLRPALSIELPVYSWVRVVNGIGVSTYLYVDCRYSLSDIGT